MDIAKYLRLIQQHGYLNIPTDTDSRQCPAIYADLTSRGLVCRNRDKTSSRFWDLTDCGAEVLKAESKPEVVDAS
jgi:hypothetical protein